MRLIQLSIEKYVRIYTLRSQNFMDGNKLIVDTVLASIRNYAIDIFSNIVKIAILYSFTVSCNANEFIFPAQAKYSFKGQPKSVKLEAKCVSDASKASYQQQFNKDGFFLSGKGTNLKKDNKFHQLMPDSDMNFEYRNGYIVSFNASKIDTYGAETKTQYKVLSFHPSNKPKIAKTSYIFQSKDGKGLDFSAPLFYEKREDSLGDSFEKWIESEKIVFHSYKFENSLVIESMKFQDSFGRNLKSRHVHEYRDDGRLISSISEDPITKQLKVGVEQEFKHDQLIIRKKDENILIEVGYNRNGFVETRKTYSPLGIKMNDYTYGYSDYDSCGNWTKGNVVIIDPSMKYDNEGNFLESNSIESDRSFLVTCPEITMKQEIEYYASCD